MQKLLIALVLVAAIQAFQYKHQADSIITTVNSDPKAKWIAGHNEYFEGMSLEQMKNLLGSIKEDLSSLPVHEVRVDGKIPTEWKASEQWPKCQTITEIRDQSHCGSCWAFAASEAMSDRICIHSNQTQQVRISSQDILACCGEYCGHGCHGGLASKAYKYWIKQGVVTGSLYNQTQYCKPYVFPPCEHHVPSGPYVQCDSLPQFETPKCVRECNSDYDSTYKADKHFGRNVYKVSHDVRKIQQELLVNGPISAAIDVYADFYQYKTGVYHHVTGDYLGGHAIKLVGWGVTEDGTEYWLLANSWNETWGEDGYFKILRGSNECDVEHRLVAGLPNLERHNNQNRIQE